MIGSLLGVYLLVAMAGVGLSVLGALAETWSDYRPRRVVANLGRRCGYSLTWPIAWPTYLIRAVREDEW